jgi:hypothetical protein
MTEDTSLIWPMRYHEHPDMITGEPRGSFSQHEFVLNALNKLQELEIATRPSGGDKTAVDKDEAAYDALNLVAQLADYVAGWAMSHQIGRALDGLQFVPVGSAQARLHPEYVAAKARADSHDHERNGGAVTPRRADPVTARRSLINILVPMAAGLNLPETTLEALKALDYGDTRPIRKTAPVMRRTGLVELELKLQALAYIEYEYRKGIKKLQSQNVVAAKFGMITPHAVRAWNMELRQTNALGSLRVDRELTFAENCGRSYHATKLKQAAGQPARNADHFEERYGLPALDRAAERWHELKQK